MSDLPDPKIFSPHVKYEHRVVLKTQEHLAWYRVEAGGSRDRCWTKGRAGDKEAKRTSAHQPILPDPTCYHDCDPRNLGRRLKNIYFSPREELPKLQDTDIQMTFVRP